MSIQNTLRTSTVQQRRNAESQPRTYSTRRIIPANQAATRLQEPHDCSHDGDMAKDKAQRRIAALFIRFATNQLLDCKTTRVTTDLQAGQSHCGNCECAHWATASSLRDDKMPRVLSDITNGNDLTPKREIYLVRRLGLTTPEKLQFQALPATEEKVDFVRSRMSPSDMHNSFHKTAYAKQLSSTLEGPKAANDLDQSLENKFRPLEEQLSSEVASKQMHFKDATGIAFNTLVDMLEMAILNLGLRIAQLELYNALETKVDLIETEFLSKKTISYTEVDDYAKTVEELLTLRSELFIKLSFSINLQPATFEQASHRLDFFWLKSFKSSLDTLQDPAERLQEFELHMCNIKKTTLLEEPPALAKARIRLLEAQGQLEGMVDLGACNVEKMDKWLFGIIDHGVLRAPTEEELFLQLIEMTKKEAARVNKTSDTPHGTGKKRPINA